MMYITPKRITAQGRYREILRLTENSVFSWYLNVRSDRFSNAER